MKKGPISEVKAKIGAIVYNKGALPKLLGKRLDEMYDRIDEVINENLDYFGELISGYACDYMKLTSPSGGHYAYVDSKTKEVLFQWTASAPDQIPAIVSGILSDSIDFKIEEAKSYGGLAILSIGVFSSEPGGMFPTIAFKGPDKKRPYGKLIVKQGEGKRTPVNVYAKFLEEGTNKMEPRPFLNKAFKFAIDRAKTEFRLMLKNELLKTMRRKKLPVYFRVYTKE